MALPLGKLTILVGAGIVGSVIAKEGHLPDVSNIFSGAFKILRQIRSNDSASPVKNPRDDALMDQVKNLRQQLEVLARDRTITIVNTSGTGARKYATIIVIVVVGYGYIWWKGWKLPDMMFATRRSLSDASNSISNRLEKVYSSVQDAKKKLSARINRLDSSLDECAALTENTKDEISVLQGQGDMICGDFKSVRVAVNVLESRIKEIEGKQVSTIEGVTKLCQIAMTLEESKATERIQASPSSSSRSAVEPPPVTPTSKVITSGSPTLSFEPPSVTPSSRTTTLPSILPTNQPSPSYSTAPYQESSRVSEVINFSGSLVDSIETHATEDKTNGSSSSGLLGLRLPGIYGSFLTRTRSATEAVAQHTRSSNQRT
ncbi:hypothetical protein L6164_010763 [Bauhinia variegata]|uniref:Uncharacterized protein n=1 Tax=Bauhinia variegata TaxID=167791 RepID=A0ACB9P4H6_BAUVA|nr:hypothetical protein L6164_010763 [Bauhinia variegata]